MIVLSAINTSVAPPDAVEVDKAEFNENDIKDIYSKIRRIIDHVDRCSSVGNIERLENEIRSLRNIIRVVTVRLSREEIPVFKTRINNSVGSLDFILLA